jgi:hypothetical protein
VIVTGSADAEAGLALSGAAEDTAAGADAAGALEEGAAEHALAVSNRARARLRTDKLFFKQIPPKSQFVLLFWPLSFTINKDKSSVAACFFMGLHKL